MHIQLRLKHTLNRPRRDRLNIDFDFESTDQCVGIFGQSGTGKSSVLKLMAGLIPCTKKQLHVNNCDYSNLPAHNNPCVYVGAEAILFEHLSVENNTRIAAHKGKFAQQSKLTFEYIVEQCGIAHLLTQKPSQLSSGEKQRVLFARALMSGKAVILLDEAFSALDWPNRIKMLNFVNQLKVDTHLQFVLVSHSLKELAYCCEQVIAMHEGQIKEKGDLQNMLAKLCVSEDAQSVFSTIKASWCEYDANDNVSTWQLSNTQQSDAENTPTQYLYSHGEPSTHRALVFNIDASQVTLSTQNNALTTMLNGLQGTITSVVLLQSRVLVSIRVGGQTLRSIISKRSAHAMDIKVGDSIYALFKAL